MTIMPEKQEKCKHRFIHEHETYVDMLNSVCHRLNHKCIKCGLVFQGEKW